MTIKEVSEKYGVEASTLRYYEKEGLLSSVSRVNGVRNYTEANLQNIEFVLCMRRAGMNIERLKRYMSMIQDDSKTLERKKILEEQRDDVVRELEDLNACLDKLNYKIEHYQKILDAEKKLQFILLDRSIKGELLAFLFYAIIIFNKEVE